MRLGQLARRLGKRPAEIVEFLSGNQIQIEEGSNTRLEDHLVKMVMDRYDPTGSTVRTEPELIEEPEVAQEKEVAADIPDETIPIATPEEILPEPEVIKATRVELPGLKVLGKIEIPEEKKKIVVEAETEPVAGEIAAANPPKKFVPENKRTNQTRQNRKDNRPAKNPIALEREREAMEAEKKRKSDLELKKELRTQHYYKKVKASTPTKSFKLMNEPVEEMHAEPEQVPKSGLGRFLKWLRS